MEKEIHFASLKYLWSSTIPQIYSRIKYFKEWYPSCLCNIPFYKITTIILKFSLSKIMKCCTLLLQTESWYFAIFWWQRCGLTFLSVNVGKARWLPRVLTVAPRTLQVKWLNRTILAAESQDVLYWVSQGISQLVLAVAGNGRGFLPSLSFSLSVFWVLDPTFSLTISLSVFLPLSSLFPCLVVHNSSSPLLFHLPFDHPEITDVLLPPCLKPQAQAHLLCLSPRS